MEFPVDTLAAVDPESLENSAKDYMSKLLYRNPEIPEYLSIPGFSKIEIGLCNVSFVPLYGVNIKQKILALFSHEEPFKAVGLYLLDRWWSAEDILKTADSSRTGLIKVRTPGERIVLYVLNRIIYRTKEIASDDVPFLCHGEDEIAKILWKNGEAIGFYSVKPEGRLCNSFLTQRYQLPVMDTIFIRKCHRGNGHGLQILKDFVDSFKNEIMGLKYPLSPAMCKVCKKYLSLYPEDKELLWEIEGVGSPFQRTQVARKLRAMDLKGNHEVMEKFNFDTEDSDIPMDVAIAPVRETMEYTEVVEEIVQIKVMKEVQDTPVTIRGRSSNLKRETLGANTEEKIIRVEEIESDVQCPEHDVVTLSMDTMETMTRDVTPISETRLHTRHRCEEQNEMTAEPTYQSKTKKQQVVEITPVMEIESLKGDENAQFLKIAIVPVELQPLELQQVVEVEIVKMSSETDEVNEKAVDVEEMKGDVSKEIPLDGREHSEEVVDSQKGQTDMATANKEDLGEEVEMMKISVVENVVDDAEERWKSVSLEEEERSEQVKEGFSVQECLWGKKKEIEDQEPSRENEEEKVSTLIQQEENLSMTYSSGSKGKHGDKQKPRHSRRLKDQGAECELTERESSSKKTLKATSNQVYTKRVDDEPKEKGFDQTESQAELHEGEQVGEIAENENVEGKIESVSIMCDKMEYSSQDETRMDKKLWKAEQEKVTVAGEVVAKTTVDGKEIGIVDVNNTDASEITLDGKAPDPSAAEHIEEQEEEPASEPVSPDIIESNEDGEGVKSDDQTEISEEEKDKTNFVTPLERSRRLKRQAEERELTKIVLKSSAKAVKATSRPTSIKQRAKTKQAFDEPEVEQIKEVVESNIRTAVEEKIESILNESTLDDVEKERNMDAEHLEEKITGCQNLMEVESKTEDENNMETKLRNEEQEEGTTAEEIKSTKDEDEKLAVVVHDAEDVRADEIEFDRKSLEPPAAEPVVEQEEEPALETVPAKVDNNTEEALATLKLQNVAVESDDREMDKGTSQPREEVVQDQRNEGKDGVNQTECEVEPNEIEQDVVMTENKHEETEVRDERMEIEENIVSKVEDKFPESTYTDDKKMDEAQEREPMQQTNTNQDIPSEEPIIHDDIESSEDDEGLKSEAKAKTSFVTSSRWSRRLEHQAAESELTKRVLRSATKATKQQVKMKQAFDDPEVEQLKKVLESHTETAVEEKSESPSMTTEPEHLKAVGIEFEEKTPGQSAAEPAKEQEEEPASETRPAEDDNTKEATSCLNAGKDANGTLKSQEEVDLELHNNPESTDTESQAAHVEKEQVMEMTENEIEETDKKVESAILNDEDGVLVSAVTDKDNMENIQKDTDTSQEIKAEEPETVCVIESSEDEGERSDVPIKLDEEEEEDVASLLTPLRRSRRLKDQVTESELIKSALRRSARLTNKATPQQSLKQQIKAMVLEEPKQLEESNDQILGSEVTVGEHMESETLHVFAEGDPETIILAVKSTCEEGSNLEKGDIEADDHRNIMNISISQGEENISSKDVTKQEKRAPEDIMHGEAEHICTSGEKSAVDVELSEATEMVHGEDENVTESTLALTLQEASVVLVDVKKVLPLDPLDLHNTEIVKDNISVEEQEEELATELAVEEDRNNVVENIYKETKLNENTEGESSDEKGETVFIRHLRRRTVTVTPRRRSKHLTGTRVAELEKMEAHVSEVCHEILAVERTEEARNAVEEMHETNSKCDSEEVPAVSEVARRDQQQDKCLPGNDAEKVEEVTDGGKQIEAEAEAVETTDRESLVEGFLLDENQEKKEPDEPNRQKVRSANSEQESDQQHNALEERLLKETLEVHLEEEKDDTMNMLITEAVLDESEEGEGVERRALGKRTITVKAASVRKSKRLRKQNQGENEGQAVKWANTDVSAPAEATVMEMADVKSPTEKEVTDSQEIPVEDTSIIGGDIAHKEVDQENTEGEETSGNAKNSQESTMTEDVSEQAQSSEFLNVSDEDTDIKPAAQEEEKGEVNREEHSATEEVMESENNAGNAAEIADEPDEFEDNQEEPEQSEKNTEGITEASVIVDENFTLELDEEINGSDAECNQVVGETKASFQESEKQISDAEPESGELTKCILRGRKSATASTEQRSAGRRRLLQGSPSETKDQSEAEEVKVVIGEEDKKYQQKRKAIVELTPRRSKRLARAEIV